MDMDEQIKCFEDMRELLENRFSAKFFRDCLEQGISVDKQNKLLPIVNNCTKLFAHEASIFILEIATEK